MKTMITMGQGIRDVLTSTTLGDSMEARRGKEVSFAMGETTERGYTRLNQHVVAMSKLNKAAWPTFGHKCKPAKLQFCSSRKVQQTEGEGVQDQNCNRKCS
ncbi:hypothetical protein ACLKA7_011983 [Drosophila subpalustris]